MDHNSISTSYDDLSALADQYRKQNKTIVLTQGTFDMLHIGHGRYLHEAKKHGDILLVGVDSDAKVKMRKGPDRPVVPEQERLEMLTYLKSVDHVVLKPVNAPKWDLIKKVKPDVLIATKETYSQKSLNELEDFCGKVVVLDPMATTSTSAKIRLVQIGAAQKVTTTISNKVITALEEALEELK